MDRVLRTLAACATLLLAACASAPPAGGDLLALRLSPASLGGTLALQQHITVTARGHTQQLDVAVEADAQAVRFAVLDLGQTVARLEWDGQVLQETRPAGWPAVVTGARVLTDLQLVYWPADAVRAGLPAGWTLQADEHGRTVRSPSDVVLRVRYLAPGAAELENVPAGYRLRMDAWPQMP